MKSFALICFVLAAALCCIGIWARRTPEQAEVRTLRQAGLLAAGSAAVAFAAMGLRLLA